MQGRRREPRAADGLTAQITLGIESSCDEMAAAVVRDGRVLSSVVHGQNEVHPPYGGVVPELASRDHVARISAVVAARSRRRASRSRSSTASP